MAVRAGKARRARAPSPEASPGASPPTRRSAAGRARWPSEIARLGLLLAIVLFALEAALALLAARMPVAAPALAALAAIATALALGGAFAALGRREHRRQARLLAYARRYADAVRWDEQLEALHGASLEIARESPYPAVLQSIVDLASGLARARYGALAVFDASGGVEEFVTFGVRPEERARIGTLPTHRGLLGRLSGEGIVRLDDVRASEAFTGMPSGHPLFRTFLGVAVRWEGELLGHLYLGGHVGEQPFTTDEERLLTMFASVAGLAIARHRLYVEYARSVRSAERRRIAMGLHDRTLQGLYALALQLGRARRQGVVALTDSMTVEAALGAVERSMASVRQLLDSLQGEAEAAPSEGTDVGEAVAETAALCSVEVAWQDEALLDALDAGARGELALCLSEAVTNAARHGRAQHVRIAAVREDGPDGDALRLDVVDDGEGALSMEPVPGHGLMHIRERALALGGEAEFVARAPDGGARVTIRVPTHAAGRDGKGGGSVGSAHPDR